MKPYALWSFFMCTLVSMQMVDPAVLWAAEERSFQIDESCRVVIAAIDGTQLMLRNGQVSKVVQFREMVNVGESLTTGNDTMADLLIGNRAVVTMGKDTVLQLLAANPEQTTIQVTKGTVRVAAAASALGQKGVVTVQTPTGQVQTRGGILRVLVEAPVGKAEPLPIGEAKPYRAAYAPERLMAAGSSLSELIQVEEGLAEILGTGGKPVALQTGQSATLRTGEVSGVGGFLPQGNVRPGVIAMQDHGQTPKEGRDYLVALQVNQATQLSKKLTESGLEDSEKEKKPTDPAKTGSGESEKKSDTKNAINGATGGVTLINTLFGNGNAANPRPSTPVLDTTGTGYGGHNNNGPFAANQASARVGLNNPSFLLVFTRKDPVMSVVNLGTDTTGNPKQTTISESRFSGDGPGGTDVSYSLILTDPNDPTSVVPATYIDGQECRGNCLASFYYDTYKTDSANGSVKYDSNRAFPDRVRFEPLLKDLNSTDPAKAFVIRKDLSPDQSGNVKFEDGIVSNFTVNKELLLIGGSPNEGHAGVPPNQQLIVRGEERILSINASNRTPANLGTLGNNAFNPTPPAMASANSTFVVEKAPVSASNPNATFGSSLFGGTLGQYTSDPDFTGDNPGLVVLNPANAGTVSAVDGAITATTIAGRPTITLRGGVALDQRTTATLGQTDATKSYFASLGTTFTGSLLSVIKGPNNVPTVLKMQDRMLGVYDGSIVQPDLSEGGKALLSVLNAKLIGPSSGIPLIDIASGAHFDREGKTTSGIPPNITVTSAIVTRSTIPLDGALLEASAPLFVLTQANMTTTSHFADLAGNATQSLNLNGALVALSAADLVVKGNLLNLSSATAAITGYLFSLNNGSTLNINGGSLFKLDNSALTLTGNAFGVFGNGTNTLTINNDLCGAGAACGTLVNSAHQPFTLSNGTQLKVAGVDHNVVLPNSFNVFAGNAAAKVNMGADDALFQIQGNSHLTINGTKVR